MNDLNLKNSPPILGRWTIKYDNLFQMPVFIQGCLINDYGELNAGDNIVLDDILSVDLKKKAVNTYGNELFLLAGEGRKMILVDDTDPGAGIIWPLPGESEAEE